MKQPTEMGMNKTGMGMSPGDSRRMAENVREGVPAATAGAQELGKLLASYAEHAQPLGTVPLPSTLKGVAATFFERLEGKQPNVLVDKLGERLVFERTGARLYDALIAKLQAKGGWETENVLPRLRTFRQEEVRHFDLLWKALEAMGADPTVETPAADVAGVESSGLLKVITDPRTTVPQFLHALLIAELNDHEGWTMLVSLFEKMGDHDTAEKFRSAQRQEEQHLGFVRNHLREIVLRELS